MTKPVHHSMHTRRNLPCRQSGAVDHDDRQPQHTGRMDFGHGPETPAVFCNNSVYLVRPEHVKILRSLKWAARNNRGNMRQRQRSLRRVDQTQQIMVLWLRGELGQMLAPYCQKDPHSLSRQRTRRAFDIWHRSPPIPDIGLPCRSLQRNQRHASLRSGLHSVGTHLGSERVRRIDQMADTLRPQIFCQPSYSAKSSRSCWQRLDLWMCHPASIRQNSGQPGQIHSLGKRAGLGRSAQNKDIRHG